MKQVDIKSVSEESIMNWEVPKRHN